MERPAMTTDREERELRHIGARVAEVLDRDAGRALPAAQRRLFEDEGRAETSGPWSGGRWLVGLAGAGAVAAIAFALRSDPAPTGPATSGKAARTSPAQPSGAPHRSAASSASDGAGFALSEGTRARTETRPDAAREVILESGELRGVVGPQAQGARAVVAGPYRVTGDADVVVAWTPTDGLTVEVKRGEARILTPGKTAVIVGPGAPKRLPPTP